MTSEYILKSMACAMLLFCLTFACPALHAGEVPKEIRVCDIGGEWPPYTFYKRDNGQIRSEVTGFSVQYLKEIMNAAGIRVKIDLLPWLRCQALVTAGKYDMLLNATASAERRRDYLVSQSYYSVHDVYFYATSRPRPKVESKQDLLLLRVCGQMGYNYTNFGLRNEEVDTGTPTFPVAMEKLLAGHCDIVLGRQEIAAGHRWINGIDYTNNKNFGWGSIAGMEPAPFHMMISRQLPYSDALLALIDQGIDQMIASKRDKELAKLYLR